MAYTGEVSLLRRLLGKVVNLSHLASAYCFYPLILLLIASDVTLRCLFNYPLAWNLETSCLLLVPAVLLAAGKTEKEDAHIKLDIVYPRLNSFGKYLIDLVGNGVALFWSAAMTVRGLEEAVISYDIMEGGAVTPVPYWPFRFLFVLAFMVLACVIMARSIDTLKKMIAGVPHD